MVSHFKMLIGVSYHASALFLGMCLLIPSKALAARERPWLPAPHPAVITEVAALPPGAGWHDVVALPGQQFLVQRQAGRDEGGLMTVTAAGVSAGFPLDAASRAALSAPSALTRSPSGGVYVVNKPSAGPTFVAQLDPATGRILQRYDLAPENGVPGSDIVAIAVHEPMIYLADEGAATLITLDMSSRRSHRFFSGYPAMMGDRPMFVNGREVLAKDGRPLQRNISALALQADGQWLYLQTPTGPVYKVSTALLRDDRYTPVELMEGLTAWRGTPTIGGITLGADDSLYLTDRSAGRILSFDSARLPWVLGTDARLVDAQTPFYDSASHALYVATDAALLRINLK